MKVHEKAVYLCEEFTDFVLLDKTRHSIIISVDVLFFKTIKRELQKIGYSVVFAKMFSDLNSITVGFVLDKKYQAKS